MFLFPSRGFCFLPPEPGDWSLRGAWSRILSWILEFQPGKGIERTHGGIPGCLKKKSGWRLEFASWKRTGINRERRRCSAGHGKGETEARNGAAPLTPGMERCHIPDLFHALPDLRSCSHPRKAPNSGGSDPSQRLLSARGLCLLNFLPAGILSPPRPSFGSIFKGAHLHFSNLGRGSGHRFFPVWSKICSPRERECWGWPWCPQPWGRCGSGGPDGDFQPCWRLIPFSHRDLEPDPSWVWQRWEKECPERGNAGGRGQDSGDSQRDQGQQEGQRWDGNTEEFGSWWIPVCPSGNGELWSLWTCSGHSGHPLVTLTILWSLWTVTTTRERGL
ncbi:uncharacterized protein LOC107214781 [Parus major]|uniref:uncharacterized protein LOC107214781 n=1 Tax=Parus major TaxID=9157 RepID=UPI00077164BC|nr:uncharacterized protein LOC107214781 [Parus major]